MVKFKVGGQDNTRRYFPGGWGAVMTPFSLSRLSWTQCGKGSLVT